VLQLASFLSDYGMDLGDAFHHPRIDWSGSGAVTVNRALSPDVCAALPRELESVVVENSVYPSHFACPNAVGRLAASSSNVGAAFVTSPWAKVAVG
jgi:gamma-glutamyltranspeptidase/glutathione hydrolase